MREIRREIVREIMREIRREIQREILGHPDSCDNIRANPNPNPDYTLNP